MKYIILLCFVACLSLQLSNKPYFYKKKSFFDINTSESVTLNGQAFKLYRATINGNKKGIERKLKESLKRYGLIHLLTPSGLHLSALTPLLLFPIYLQFIILLIFYFWIESYGSYLSLERVTIFALFTKFFSYFKFTVSTNHVFLICMCFSLISGNTASSPGSYLYSLLFWGTIMIFKENPVRSILFLNISLQFITNISGESCHLSSIIINPLFSTIYIACLPFFVLNAFLGGSSLLEPMISGFLSYWSEILQYFDGIDSGHGATLSLMTISILAITLQKKLWKLSVLILCLNISELNIEVSFVKNFGKNISSHNCEYDYPNFKCKKKPSKKRAHY